MPMTVGRRVAVAVVALSVLAFTGCAAEPDGSGGDVPHDAASGGQTRAEMRESVETIPGVVVSDLVGGEGPNIKGNTGYSVALEVEPGYLIADGAALVDFIVSSVWSVREGYMPNATIDISVRTSSGEGFDVAVAATDSGWIRTAAPRPGAYNSTSIEVAERKGQGARNLERLGSWPGEVPQIPDGVIIPE